MKKHLLTLVSVALLLVSCAPQSQPVLPTHEPTTDAVATSPPTTPQPYTNIRYALVGRPSAENIWSLFDVAGASYPNYATQADAHPRLYQLAAEDGALQPLAAESLPSPIKEEGGYYTAIVKIQSGQQWTDGTPISAEDVVFTFSTVREFDLGLNWQQYYPEKLYLIEAQDAQTLKYYFSSPPNAGEWQHGVLIGVFASQAYWAPEVAKARLLLPSSSEADEEIAAYQAELAWLKAAEEDIRKVMQPLKESSQEYRNQDVLLENNLAAQNLAQYKLDVAERDKRDGFAAARAALYSAPPSPQGSLKNYRVYTRENALQALINNEIDFILNNQTLTPDEAFELSIDPNISFAENPKNDIRFLVFNHSKALWNDIALRRAFSCLIDTNYIAKTRLDGRVVPALGWVPVENQLWHTSIISPPCAGMDADARLEAAVRTMQQAGYVWEQEPSGTIVGAGLKLPSGEAFPSITLFAPLEDSSRYETAYHIEGVINRLGIPLRATAIPNDELFYRLYGIKDYDLVITGWELSLYPRYICDFFGSNNAYGYQNDMLNEKCAEFLSESDIALARKTLFQMEVLLWDGLPAIPLFSSKVIEAYRNFSLPFETHLGGFAPTLYQVPNVGR